MLNIFLTVHGLAAAQPAPVHLWLWLRGPSVSCHHAQRGSTHHADHQIYRILQKHLHPSREQRLCYCGLLWGWTGLFLCVYCCCSPSTVCCFMVGGCPTFFWIWSHAYCASQHHIKVIIILMILKLCCTSLMYFSFSLASQSCPPRHWSLYTVQISQTGILFVFFHN